MVLYSSGETMGTVVIKNGKAYVWDDRWVTVGGEKETGRKRPVLIKEEPQIKEPNFEGDDVLNPDVLVLKGVGANEHLIKRGRPMTHEEADGNKPNPHYDTDENQQEICQACALAYEMRRRGYDVEARGFKQEIYQKEFTDNPAIVWIDPKTGNPPKRTAIFRGTGINDNYYKNLEKQIKNDFRYHLGMTWKNAKGGHIVTVQRDPNGTLILYDPLDGRTFKGEEDIVKNYLGHAGTVYYYRVDNLKVNPEKAARFLVKAGSKQNGI